MILFDGKKTVDQVLAATEGWASSPIDIDHLLALGYIGVPADAAASLPGPASAVAPPIAVASGAPAPQRHLRP